MHEYMHKHIIFLRILPQWVTRKKNPTQPTPNPNPTRPTHTFRGLGF